MGAEGEFKTAATGFYHILGPDHWLTITAEFEAALMNAMNDADCGSAIAFRILQESLVVLNGVRQKYIREEILLEDLNQTLVLMAKLARFWTEVVTVHKVAKYLASKLGPYHPKTRKMRQWLERAASKWVAASRGQKTTRDSFSDDFRRIHARSMEAAESDQPFSKILAIATLCDHVPETEQAQHLAMADGPRPRLTEAGEARKKHRTSSLLGAVLSFGGDLEDAEKHLQRVQRQPDVEVCTEIKIHNLLFFAEHKTREQDWDVARRTMRQISDMWQHPDDSVLPQLKAYFEGRVRKVVGAISTRHSVDETSYDSIDPSGHQSSPSSRTPSLIGTPRSPSPGRDGPPLTPGGYSPSIHTAIKSESPSLSDGFSPRAGKGLQRTLKDLNLHEAVTSPAPAKDPFVQPATGTQIDPVNRSPNSIFGWALSTPSDAEASSAMQGDWSSPTNNNSASLHDNPCEEYQSEPMQDIQNEIPEQPRENIFPPPFWD
jgi:hypothetical protein